MKNIFLLLLTFSFLVDLRSQDKDGKQPFMVKQLATERFSSAEVSTSGGSISVTGVKAAEARVEVYISSNQSSERLTKEEIQTRLSEKYEFEIKVVNDKLVAFARHKDRERNTIDWKKSLSIGFRLFVADNVSTNLTTSGGSINITWMNANHDFSTSGGSLNILHVNGKIKGRTSGGSINLENSGKDIDLSTSGGSINASDCVGKITLHTSGGSVNLENLDGLIRANTSGGSINGTKIAGDLVSHTSGGSIDLEQLSCSLETSTSGGNISVSITKLVNFVRINNSAGNVDLTLPQNTGMDLDLSGRIKNTDLHGFEGSIKDDAIKGKLKGGGVPVTVDAGEGRVTLRFK